MHIKFYSGLERPYEPRSTFRTCLASDTSLRSSSQVFLGLNDVISCCIARMSYGRMTDLGYVVSSL